LFLAEALEQLGFVTRECGRASEVNAELKARDLDLIVIGLLTPESDIGRVLHVLSMSGYRGKVMLFGARASMALLALHDLGERAGLEMLPPLRTPFRDSDLTDNLSVFLPITPFPVLPVDIGEALAGNRLELWYEPKIDLGHMLVRAVCAELRIRHPASDIVTPASLGEITSEPQGVALSDFLLTRAFADWDRFFERRPLIELVMPLPLSALAETPFVDRLCRQLPAQAGVSRLTVEIAGLGAAHNTAAIKTAAWRLAKSNVAISIPDGMAESSWADIKDFPVAEFCVQPDYVRGCADDRHKRTACGKAVQLAGRFGARATARGLTAPADFRCICDMGFHFGQGELLGKPMDPEKFARTALRGRPAPLR
jgi:EAL domain-containing protein (putative c-di-GMP-specific phosphodiesterase class I)